MNKEEILKTEYSTEFDDLRKNRVFVSFFKYGPIKVNAGDKLVDIMGCLERCIKKYQETGNTEYLLDAGNYCMFEYMFPQHSKAHFRATDTRESAGIVGMSINEIKRFRDE